MSGERVLVVDSQRVVRWSLQEHLARSGYRVDSCATRDELQRAVEAEPCAVAIVDPSFDGGFDLSVLKTIRRTSPLTAVIVMGENLPPEAAVQAVKLGAEEFISKPVDLVALTPLLADVVDRCAVRLKGADGWGGADTPALIGQSPPMRRVVELVHRVAQSTASTVLILGESGTGKDVVARAVHALSDRAKSPFLNITCTAIAENLLENELFGHEKGAFTDARSLKRGLFELCHQGTVFLDEVGDMPLSLQAKLLRVLEERRFRRVGGAADIEVDLRVVAATNCDLRAMVTRGRFREDLFYRLNVVPIEIPPLREREGDVRLLVSHFITEMRKRTGRDDLRGVTAEALDMLERYSWPGNVRELKNVIERATILGVADRIEAVDLPVEVLSGRPPLSSAARQMNGNGQYAAQTPSPPPSGNGNGGSASGFVLPREGVDLRALERDLLIQALRRVRGNRTRASRLLHLKREQVRYRIQKFGLTEADYMPAEELENRRAEPRPVSDPGSDSDSDSDYDD